MTQKSLIRWSSEAMHTDLKAAAALAGVSVNTYVENAVAAKLALDSGGVSPRETLNTANSGYVSAGPTYRSMVSDGFGHDSIIQQLGGTNKGESQ